MKKKNIKVSREKKNYYWGYSDKAQKLMYFEKRDQ